MTANISAHTTRTGSQTSFSRGAGNTGLHPFREKGGLNLDWVMRHINTLAGHDAKHAAAFTKSALAEMSPKQQGEMLRLLDTHAIASGANAAKHSATTWKNAPAVTPKSEQHLSQIEGGFSNDVKKHPAQNRTEDKILKDTRKDFAGWHAYFASAVPKATHTPQHKAAPISPATQVTAHNKAVGQSVLAAFDRYDALHGKGVLDRAVAQSRSNEARIDAQATAQVNKEFGTIMLAGPVIAGSIVFLPLASEKGGEFILAKTGLAGTAAIGVKAGVGGTVSSVYTETTIRGLSGRAPTTGERIGSFATGAIFAPGVFSITNKFSAPVNAAINGGASGFLGNGGGQIIDIFSDTKRDWGKFDFKQLATSTIIGTGASMLGGTVQPYYSRTPSLGNSQSIAAGVKVGAREIIHAAPATVITNVTQAHLDALNAVAPYTTQATPTPKSNK